MQMNIALRAFFLFLVFFAQIAPAETLMLAAEDDWPPYSNADGSGMSNALVMAAYRAVGIDVRFAVRPYARVMAELEAGEWVGGFNVSRQQNNEKKFKWGKHPLLVSREIYYVMASRPLQAKSGQALQQGQRIGCVIGYEYGDEFSNNTRIDKQCVRSNEQNIKKLLEGRIDAMLASEKTAKVLISKAKLNDKIVPAFVSSELPTYVAFSKAHPDADYYMKKLDEGLEIIKANGEYQRIEAGY